MKEAEFAEPRLNFSRETEFFTPVSSQSRSRKKGKRVSMLSPEVTLTAEPESLDSEDETPIPKRQLRLSTLSSCRSETKPKVSISKEKLDKLLKELESEDEDDEETTKLTKKLTGSLYRSDSQSRKTKRSESCPKHSTDKNKDEVSETRRRSSSSNEWFC